MHRAFMCGWLTSSVAPNVLRGGATPLMFAVVMALSKGWPRLVFGDGVGDLEMHEDAAEDAGVAGETAPVPPRRCHCRGQRDGDGAWIRRAMGRSIMIS